MSTLLPTAPQPPDHLKPEPASVALAVRLFEMLDYYLNGPRYIIYLPALFMASIGYFYFGWFGAFSGVFLFFMCIQCLFDIQRWVFPKQTSARNELRYGQCIGSPLR